MEQHLKIIGCTMIVLAIIHIAFPKHFNWKNELSKITLISRQMMYVHTLFIAIAVLLMGVLCITSATDLVNTTLGNRLVLGLGLFWLIRFVVQLFGYSSKLWKGKRFETFIHILFSFLWIYFFTVFLGIGLRIF